MDDLVPFARLLFGIGLVGAVAVGSNRLASWLRIPPPGTFLILAVRGFRTSCPFCLLPIVDDQRIVTVALACHPLRRRYAHSGGGA